MEILKESQPIARKEHTCMFCGGKIAKGQKYFRQTNVIDGELGDFICHTECNGLAHELDMYNDCDPNYGLSPEEFVETVNQYIYDNHYDQETDDIAVEWQDLTLYEEVCKILKELDNDKD
ncbi:MAG: hypothetical protein K1W14_06485 [Muribaculaceae bacterium]